MKHLEKLLWWLITGKRGGVNRARIIKKLKERPYNAHQLSKELDLDYKTIRHHIKILWRIILLNQQEILTVNYIFLQMM